jgi:predicted transcriptional regulator of viral defense system
VAQIAQRVGRERALAEVAARQHGVIGLRQLLAIGLCASAVRGRVAAGRLARLHRGVYAVPGVRLGPHARSSAAVLACGSGAVLSHRSAAALLRFRETAATRIDVTSPRRAGRSREGIVVHRADRLSPSEITVVTGIPCTTVARTVVDLASVLAPEALEYAIHRAQTQRLLQRAEIVRVLARSPTRRGTAVVRRVLSLSNVAEDEVRSVGERRLVRICAREGLPMPRVNAWIALDGDGLEVDFSWPDQRLAVEVDSRAHHTTNRAFENDPRRDRRLMLAGWRVARFTYRDVTERPSAVAAELRSLLRL